MAYREDGNKIEIMRATKFPDVLVVTPLLNYDYLRKRTRETMQKNTLKYFWITSEGPHNIPTNALKGINWAKKNLQEMPKYYIMIDGDIILGKGMLDKLFRALEKSEDKIGFAYASFQFKGEHVLFCDRLA